MNSLPTKCKKTTVFPYSILASDIFFLPRLSEKTGKLELLGKEPSCWSQSCNSAVSKKCDGAGNTPALSLR